MKKFTYILITIIIFLISCEEDDPVYPKPDIPDSLKYVIPKYIYNGSTFAFVYNDKIIKTKILDIECFESQKGMILEEQATRSGISSDSALALGIKAKALADSLILGKEIKIIRDSTRIDYDSWGRLYRYVEVDGMRYDSIMIERNLIVVPK